MITNLILVVILAAEVYGHGHSPHGHEISAEFASSFYSNVREDALLDVPGLVKKYGYPIEEHSVLTKDGYILGVHRIPHGKHNHNGSRHRTPALLMHGLLSSSADWAFMGPGKGLAYILADAGYDVWMANARGNYYSRAHVILNPDRDLKFWNFSWHEIGYYDLPAMIDHILKATGIDGLHYVGHSQGTTTFFVFGSTRPEYNAKIYSMQALAPVAYMSNQQNALFTMISPLANNFVAMSSLFGIGELWPNQKIMSIIGQMVCRGKNTLQQLCANVFLAVSGANIDQFNLTMILAKLGHVPAGASTRQLSHYGQLISNGFFRQYDHGVILNLIRYGSLDPPAYSLEKITAPVCLHYSLSDLVAHRKDVYQLCSEIGNNCELHEIPLEVFNHIDFMWAINAKEIVYNKVLKLMREYDSLIYA